MESRPVTQLSDAELIRETRAGQPEAYGELVTRYQGHVYGLAYSMVGRWEEAQDIAQETFLRAYTNLDQLQDPQRFAAWLRRVTVSVTLNWIRAYKPGFYQHLSEVDFDTLELPDFAPGPQEVLERRELAKAVLQAVSSLPPKYRVPLAMFHLDGLSYQKVADFLDIPLGTAKTLIHRARTKLREALAPYVLEALTPMVQEVFDEHKLPDEFAGRVLKRVPKLAWAKECTFLGALEAALAVTEHPFSYLDLMGWSGMAFRVRWFAGNDTDARWCPSSAVAEMEEEIGAVMESTGWPLRVEFMQGEDTAVVQRLTQEVTASINADRPVLVYDAGLDMAVAYGYEEGGKFLLLRGYHQEEPLRLPPAQLGFLMLFLGDHGPEKPRPEAFCAALKRAVHNWDRERAHEGPGDYWYGRAAYARWAADLERGHEVEADQQPFLRGVSRFCYFTLRGARRDAVQFLRAHESLVEGEAREALLRAADLYAQEAALLDREFRAGTAFNPEAEWTDEVRQQEVATLRGACALEEAAIREMKAILT
jgi:RNA polymerase sigma-70 factor (ECF subfamily)